MDPAQALQPAVEMLADPDSEVRATVARALSHVGEPAVPAVAAALEEPGMESGALLALGQLPADGQADRIRKFALTSGDKALRDHHFAMRLTGTSDERRILLRDSLARCAKQQALNAMRAVALLSSDRSLIEEAIGNLESGDRAQRAGALELIDSAKDATSLRRLVAIWEEASTPTSPSDDLIVELLHHPDPWVRECAEFVLTTQPKGGSMARALPTLSVMERVLFMRKVAIFDGLPPEDLKSIAAIAEENAHSDGDVIVTQGEDGGEMHVIVSGTVAVIVNGREVARTHRGDVVGEMALILDQPRMATLSAAGDVHLLTIGQREFAGILRERPETSLAVMRVLARRLEECDALRAE
jgi:CRP/FNR family transcriptional regulator, cyclic AMP receptor protein